MKREADEAKPEETSSPEADESNQENTQTPSQDEINTDDDRSEEELESDFDEDDDEDVDVDQEAEESKGSKDTEKTEEEEEEEEEESKDAATLAEERAQAIKEEKEKAEAEAEASKLPDPEELLKDFSLPVTIDDDVVLAEGTDEETTVKEFKEANPEFASYIENITGGLEVAMKSALTSMLPRLGNAKVTTETTITDELDKRLKEIEDKQVHANEYLTKVEKEEALKSTSEALGSEKYGSHKDAKDILVSSEFWEWVENDASDGINLLVENSDDIGDAKLVVEAYKDAKGIKYGANSQPAKRKAEQDINDSVNTGKRVRQPATNQGTTETDLDSEFDDDETDM